MRKLQRKMKLVNGVGVNDADYAVKPCDADGKRRHCLYYEAWFQMLNRAYSQKYHAKRPTYTGVTVCEEWHSFMAFRAWMMTQDWEGKQLDKDIIVPGNKVYSPATCAFVPCQINSLLTDSAASRGEWPIGVDWHRQAEKFQARVRENGKQRYLGLFITPEAAHLAWRKEKLRIVRTAARECDDPRVSAGLLRHSYRIEAGLAA
tara:strand:+ start:37 stop:648 length:612 start_codon:yes stop_codon:yes gene_type:complete